MSAVRQRPRLRRKRLAALASVSKSTYPFTVVRSLAAALVIFVCPVAATFAEDPAAPHWSVLAECQMIVLPQKLALPLIPGLLDDKGFAKAYADLQTLLEKDQAKLVADLIVKGVAGADLASESSEEIRYPTEFEPPQFPQEVTRENIVEVLKSWPLIGPSPTAFEMRRTGPILEVHADVSTDGEWLYANLKPQHTRLLRYEKFATGLLPSGKTMFVEQPQFYTVSSTLTLQVHSGQWLLAGIHTLPAEQGLELFILRLTAQKTGKP